MVTTLRVLADAPAGAAWNMAVDEALLLGGHPATLRFYGWSPHAISLGYFQSVRDFEDVAPHTTIVRRLTGGGAIHHGDELTFSLTIDGELLRGSVADSYRDLHDALVDALRDSGIDSHRLEAGNLQAARPRERWCFAEPGRDDIVTGRGKLIGSAQRRLRTPHERVLHHGSLVLRRPALTPFVAAVADAPTPPDVGLLRQHFTVNIARCLGLQAMAGTLTTAERQRADVLERQRYLNPAWNRRR